MCRESSMWKPQNHWGPSRVVANRLRPADGVWFDVPASCLWMCKYSDKFPAHQRQAMNIAFVLSFHVCPFPLFRINKIHAYVVKITLGIRDRIWTVHRWEARLLQLHCFLNPGPAQHFWKQIPKIFCTLKTSWKLLKFNTRLKNHARARRREETTADRAGSSTAMNSWNCVELKTLCEIFQISSS